MDHFFPAEDVLISFPFTSKIFPTYARGHSALAHISIVEFCSPLRIASGKAPGPRLFSPWTITVVSRRRRGYVWDQQLVCIGPNLEGRDTGNWQLRLESLQARARVAPYREWEADQVRKVIRLENEMLHTCRYLQVSWDVRSSVTFFQ